VDVVVALDLGFLLLLLDFVVDHEFLLALVLALVQHHAAVLLQLILSVFDEIVALKPCCFFSCFGVGSRGLSDLLIEGGSFGLKDFGEAHTGVRISGSLWQLLV